MLDVIQLGCERDDRTLFSNLSFLLSPGEILQIEGRNGAGKTTLLRILAGLSTDYSGDIHWKSLPLNEVYGDFRLNCYFLGHKPGLKPELTPLENLRWRLQIANNSPQQSSLLEALQRVQLGGFEEVPCSHLSAGQHRRVAIAGLFISDALLWILDEPFTSIDMDGIDWLEARLYEHAERGGMVLVTSHQPLKQSSNRLRKISLTDYQEIINGDF